MKPSKQKLGREKVNNSLGKAVTKILADREKYDENDPEHVKKVTGEKPAKGG